MKWLVSLRNRTVEFGRGHALKSPPIKMLADELGLNVIQPEKLRAPEAMNQLRLWSPDLIVVAAFGQTLKPDVLSVASARLHQCSCSVIATLARRRTD